MPRAQARLRDRANFYRGSDEIDPRSLRQLERWWRKALTSPMDCKWRQVQRDTSQMLTAKTTIKRDLSGYLSTACHRNKCQENELRHGAKGQPYGKDS